MCEADGKRLSILLAFNRPVLLLEKVEGIGNQELKITSTYLFFSFCVCCRFISFILYFLFSFSFFQSRTRPGWRQLGRQQSAPAQRSETLIHSFASFLP